MSSAQLESLALKQAPGEFVLEGAAPHDLKQQVAERLAAHRQRRLRAPEAGVDEAQAEAASRRRGSLRHNPIAAAVAERYAQTPSYRAFLAEQAQRAIDEAAREAESRAAEAEVAARNAQAIAVAQQNLIEELERWKAPQEFTPAAAEVSETSRIEPAERSASQASVPVKEVSSEGLTVRLYEDIGPTRRSQPASTNAFVPADYQDPEEATVLDEEIAFRQSPVFEPYVIEPTVPLPANLLEFPRQLVAARRARPRLAEGPLLDAGAPRSPQLRIFEVEAEQISHLPEPSVTPVWANIRLDAHAVSDAVISADTPLLGSSMLPPATAPMSLRIMATTVDAAIIAIGFIGFVAVASHIADGLPTGIPGTIAAGCTLAVFYLLYQLLFFSFSEQTPGMRYARLGFCTFADGNPTRSAIRRRILAQMVALCPFGVGILWSLLDDDKLGWHDRISRMYPRAY